MRVVIRDATAKDAGGLAALATELGFLSTADDVAVRMRMLERAAMPPLVAVKDGDILGCLTWHIMAVLHRPAPVARITMLIVTAPARGQGIGKSLVEAAETRCLQRGCHLIEVTSNLRLAEAHRFYERLGFERTSYRFARNIGDLTG